MRVLNDVVEMVPTADLKLHPRNVNEGDVGAIHESIAANGFYGTIVAQKSTGHILAGNHRFMAAAQEGATEVPVAWVDVDDDHALRILLADNRTTRLGHDDPEQLARLLQEVIESQGTLGGTGYDGDALDELLHDLGLDTTDAPDDPGAQTDRAEELREVWGTERGQIWAIPSKTVPGKSHRLMCGDSTSEQDVGRLLGGAEPRLMVTDPPYGVEYDATWRGKAGHATLGKNRTGKVVADDRADWREAWDLFPGAVAYVWHGGLHTMTVAESLVAARFDLRSQIIWNKSVMVMGRGDYHWKHEPCWYAVRKGATGGWVSGRDQTTVWDLASPIHIMSGSDEEKTEHPTQKPMECMARPIRNHEGDVYEPFAGSGTTYVAAEGERRICYGMEIDPGYVAVILQRLTGMGMEPHRVTRDEEATVAA